MDDFYDTPVSHDDFNLYNDIGIFEGPLPELYANVTREELKVLQNSSEEFVLLSVLDPEEHGREHICGSVNIPVARIELEAVPTIKRDSIVIVYGRDENCLASAVAVDKLMTLGYKTVLRYKGGVEDWRKAGWCMEGSLAERKKAAPRRAA